MIKIYNPRWFLRNGSAQPMNDVADGHTVIIRCGEVAPTGEPVIHNPKTGNAGPQFDRVRDRVFKLVECDEKEIARLEKRVKFQKGL